MLGKIKSNKGMSYIEVIVCLLMVSIMVLPLSASFVSATRMREEASSLSQSTFYAETLLEEVKEQLTRDIIEAEKVEKNLVPQGDLAYYLDEKTSMTTKTTPHHLTAFIEQTTNPEAYIKKQYGAERYTYEIALWPIKHYLASSKTPSGAVTVDQAIKLYTDTDEKYQVNSGEVAEGLPQFIVENDEKEILEDTLFLESTSIEGVALSSFSGLGTIKLEEKPSGAVSPKLISATDLGITINEIKVKSALAGYLCTIEPLYTGGTGLIIVDARSVNMEGMSEIVLKFHHKGGSPLLIKLLVKEEDLALDATNGESKVDHKLKIVIADETIGGKTTLEKVAEINEEHSYLIGMIVRDKKPQLGKPGKIVKTMMELYSFEASD